MLACDGCWRGGKSLLGRVGADCTGIIFNTRVAWVRALGVNVCEALEECPQ